MWWQLTALAATITLVVYAAAGWGVRYVADDFGRAASLRQLGWLGAQNAEFRGWSGRFSAEAAILTVMLLGQGVARVLPAVLLATWSFALIWALQQLAIARGLSLRRWQIALLAQTVIVTTIAAAPDLFESLYWLTGSLTYLAPLVLATLMMGVIARQWHRQRAWWGAVVALMAFLAGGFSDTYVCGQTTALALALALVWRRRGAHGSVMAAGLSGSIASLLLVALAPGNAAREAYMPARHPLTWVLAQSSTEAVRLMVSTVAHHPLEMAVMAVATGVTLASASETCIRARRPLVCLIVASLLVIVAMEVPAFWATSTAPPRRAQLDPVFVVTLAMGILGVVLGLTLRGRLDAEGARRFATLAPAVVAVVLILTAVPVLTAMPDLLRYAHAKDAQAVAIRKAGRGDVRAPAVNAEAMGPLSYDNVEEMTSDSGYWVNQLEEKYYRVPSIAVSARP